jgi:hypothetical protein
MGPMIITARMSAAKLRLNKWVRREEGLTKQEFVLIANMQKHTKLAYEEIKRAELIRQNLRGNMEPVPADKKNNIRYLVRQAEINVNIARRDVKKVTSIALYLEKEMKKTLRTGYLDRQEMLVFNELKILGKHFKRLAADLTLAIQNAINSDMLRTTLGSASKECIIIEEVLGKINMIEHHIFKELVAIESNPKTQTTTRA